MKGIAGGEAREKKGAQSETVLYPGRRDAKERIGIPSTVSILGAVGSTPRQVSRMAEKAPKAVGPSFASAHGALHRITIAHQ